MREREDPAIRFDEAYVAGVLSADGQHADAETIREIAEETGRFVARRRMREQVREFILRTYQSRKPIPRSPGPWIHEPRVEIWAASSCAGNPGPGGYATMITAGPRRLASMTGKETSTTPNRMAMTAALDGLRRVAEESEITLYSDSPYLCNGMNRGWVEDWERRGWKRARGTLQNADLWKSIREATAGPPPRRVRFIAVEANSGYPNMEYAQSLASKQAEQAR